jgi:hypothetical protein
MVSSSGAFNTSAGSSGDKNSLEEISEGYAVPVQCDIIPSHYAAETEVSVSSQMKAHSSSNQTHKRSCQQSTDYILMIVCTGMIYGTIKCVEVYVPKRVNSIDNKQDKISGHEFPPARIVSVCTPTRSGVSER